MENDPNRKFDRSDRRPRRLEETNTEEVGFPLVWIVIGGLAGLIVIGLVGLGVVNLVRQGAITPTPQELPPLVAPVETPTSVATPTQLAESAATETSVTVDAPAGETPSTAETPDAEAPPTEAAPPPSGDLVIGGYAKVIGTDGAGLSMRAGPGRNNARVGLAEEDDETILVLVDGPREDENGEDYVWWFVRHPDGTEGWVVVDYLAPAAAP